MTNKEYTDEELLTRVLAREAVSDIMIKRAFLAAGEQRRQELSELWVQEEENKKTASYGKNWGYYTGMDSIFRYYVEKHEKEMEGISEGYSSFYPVSAPSIQVAGDGKTAKGLWYSVGYRNKPLPDGSIDAKWIAQKVAGDFILEKDGWRLWHLLEISDSAWTPGTDYHEDMPVFEQEDDPLKVEFGKPDIEVQTHDRQFCWADKYPFMPEKYETFTPDISWGPEGFKPYAPSIRAREVILKEPTVPLGTSSCGKAPE